MTLEFSTERYTNRKERKKKDQHWRQGELATFQIQSIPNETELLSK